MEGLSAGLAEAAEAGRVFTQEHAAAAEALAGDDSLERDVRSIHVLARRVDAKQLALHANQVE